MKLLNSNTAHIPRKAFCVEDLNLFNSPAPVLSDHLSGERHLPSAKEDVSALGMCRAPENSRASIPKGNGHYFPLEMENHLGEHHVTVCEGRCTRQVLTQTQLSVS